MYFWDSTSPRPTRTKTTRRPMQPLRFALLLSLTLACGGGSFTHSAAIAHPLTGAPPELRFHEPVPTDVVPFDAINGDFYTEVALEIATADRVCFDVRERMPVTEWLATTFALEGEGAAPEVEVLDERVSDRPPVPRESAGAARERVCTRSRRDGSCAHYLTRGATRPTPGQVLQRRSRVCFAGAGLLTARAEEIVLTVGPPFTTRYRWQLGTPCDGRVQSCGCPRYEGLVDGTCVPLLPASPQHRTQAEMCGQWTQAQAPTEIPPPARSGCETGPIPDAVVASIVNRTNTYRWLSGLPPVRFAGHDAGWQSCATIVDEGGVLDHYPPPSRACFTPGGRAASEVSNMSLGHRDPANAIDGQMEDRGESNQRSLGHRRWLLSPELGALPIGAVGRGVCIGVQDESGFGPEWSAYPNPGFTPLAIARQDAYSFHTTQRLDQVRVSMSVGGQPVPVQQYALPDGMGRQPGVGWHHVGWQPEPGVEVQVEIETDRQTYRYSFTPVDC